MFGLISLHPPLCIGIVQCQVELYLNHTQSFPVVLYRPSFDHLMEVTGLDPSEEETALLLMESVGKLGDKSDNHRSKRKKKSKKLCELCDKPSDRGLFFYQDDGIDICSHFLVGKCSEGDRCQKHHAILPYHWQVREVGAQVWSCVRDNAQEDLERLFCDPKREQVIGVYKGIPMIIDFITMEVRNNKIIDRIRRLSTSTSDSLPFYTAYKYYYSEGDNWVEYNQEFVTCIENGLKNDQKKVHCSSAFFRYTLHLTKMYQINVDTGTKRAMRKRPIFRPPVLMLSDLWTVPTREDSFDPPQAPRHSRLKKQYPKHWIVNDISSVYERIILSEEASEYPCVYRYFHNTMAESLYAIKEISIIQNYFQWEKYTRKRDHMIRTKTQGNFGERYLFHGTDHSLVEAICRQNFDPRVCGKNGLMYGQGSYFATEANYSHRFCNPTSSGHYYMFLAKVLIGRPAVGNPLHRRPPPLNPDDPASPLYDSCASRMNHPDIFVLFDNDQFYPYFMIKYQKVEDQVILE